MLLVLFAPITLILIFFFYLKWTFQYWRRRNVPFLEPGIPFGNLAEALRGKEHTSINLKRLYHEMRSRGWKHGGIYMYNKPLYFAIDLDYVKNVLIKDFSHFTNRDLYVNENEELQAHLVNLKGNKWRNLRIRLTPTFSSGKIKMMFNVMAECRHGLLKRMSEECLKNEAIDIYEVLACFTTNVIGSCAFGLDCKALEEEDSKFRLLGRKMFATTVYDTVKRLFLVTFPRLANLLNVTLIRQDVKDCVKEMIQSVIKYREENNIKRNDFLQLLIDLEYRDSENEDEIKHLTLNEIASQCFIFFGAGFEAPSTLMTFALYELSKNQDIQDKLRKEINLVLQQHENQLSFDAIQDMKYLSQVIDETLRMYPPAALLNRKCVKDYQVPGEDLIIEKGTTVFFSTLGIHHDPEYYPNPSKFDPDRFTLANKSLRHGLAFMPFGEGPRICIGLRFALLQVKVGLVSLIINYKFAVHKDTQEPLIYKPNSTVLTSQNKILLRAEKI